jgi:hypothetical protein
MNTGKGDWPLWRRWVQITNAEIMGGPDKQRHDVFNILIESST